MWIKSLLGALLLFSLVAQAEDGIGPALGKPAPNLIAHTLEDKPYLLNKDNASPKVLNFFWVQCKPCRAELPELAKLE